MGAPGSINELMACFPQATLAVDPEQRVSWREPGFERKTSLKAEVGAALVDLLAEGAAIGPVVRALESRRRYEGRVVTRSLREMQLTLQPRAGGGHWAVFSASGFEEELAFASCLQEIARAVGATLDLDSVCAAAALAITRFAHVARVEVHLAEGDGSGALRRVAVSDVGATAAGEDSVDEATLRVALSTLQPQLFVSRGTDREGDRMCVALPLVVHQRVMGVLLLTKPTSSAFSIRELDMWSAAAGQLAVAVDNARLLREAHSALQVREEFMSIASHELKTPLTPLTLSLQSIERQLARGEEVASSRVSKARRQVERLTSLVNELLDVTRLDSGRLELRRAPVELRHLVHAVVEGQRSGPAGRTWRVELPDAPIWVMGDRDRLDQVLVNLLENANKYSPPDAPVRVKAWVQGGRACVQVVDEGIGVPERDQASIFHRFYRGGNASSRNFGGLGLGLFLCRSLVEQHGGLLALRSTEDAGSVFTMELPALDAAAVVKLPRRVLLLDPESEARQRDAQTLVDEGYEVSAVAELGQALQSLSAAPVDLVLLPERYEGEPVRLLMEALVELPSPPVVVTADANATRQGVREAERARALLLQREKQESVAAVVRRALAG